MKKNLARKLTSEVFAVLSASLLIVGAAGCSTMPSEQEPVAAEIPATVDSSLDSAVNSTNSVSSTDTVSSSTSSADPVGGSAPMSDIPAPSSLGASSSGRGH